MTNNGSISQTLNAGGSYTIPKGYHDGTGKVTANTLSSQTSATAEAKNILIGKTAYVNGSKVTGTLPNRSVYNSLTGNMVSLNSTNYSSVAVSKTDENYAYHWMNNSDGITRLCVQVPGGLYGGPEGYGEGGDGYVGIPVTKFGTATSSSVLSGTSFTSKDGLSISGTMANKSGATVSATTVTESGTNALISIPANGYYDTNSKISVPIETIKNNVDSLNNCYMELVSDTFSFDSTNFYKKKLILKNNNCTTINVSYGAYVNTGIDWRFGVYDANTSTRLGGTGNVNIAGYENIFIQAYTDYTFNSVGNSTSISYTVS